jgi:aryl-alcohol dehydrogenase-like predicted oxidoreductase
MGPGARLGFGAWAVGGGGWGTPAAESDRVAAVQLALERGVTFFDTAPTYGDGASETLLGQAVKPARERVAVATKVGPHDDPRASLEGSLRRLATDYVDLVQLHEPLGRWEWVLERLHTLQEEGKSLAIGICNATHLQLRRAAGIAPVVSLQSPYNLFDRDVEQRELPWCRDHAIAFLAYRPLASGLLTGKFTAPPAFAAGDHRRRIYWFQGKEFERRRAAMERLQPLAERLGVTLTRLALSWLLAQPGVSVVLAGVRDRHQAEEVFPPDTQPLTPDTLQEVDAIVASAFPLARATGPLKQVATGWGERERFIVDRLDGTTPYERIGAEWTDRGESALIAAQVKVFVDQLADQNLVTEV